jgi:pilus assembly protein CpaE
MTLAALEPGASTSLIRLGNIDDAITYLALDPSPRSLVIDLSGVREPLAALDRLAEVCMPGTRVIAIGETNDIHFYRLLRGAGVAEYLVKPVTVEALRSAMTNMPVERQHLAQRQLPAVGKSSLTAVVGARGGIGTTMVAVSLAWLFAESHHCRTVLVDLDINCGSTGLALDAAPGTGLSEALASPQRIDELLISSSTAKLGENLYLLSSEQHLDSVRRCPPDAVLRLTEGLRTGFERIILDVPRSDPELLRQGMEHADTILILTDFSLAGVRDTGRLIALAEKTAPKAKRIVVGNRLGCAKKGELPRAEIEKALGVKLTVVIPEDGIVVPEALCTGKAVPAAAGGSPVGTSLRELAAITAGITPTKPQGRTLARLLEAAMPRKKKA